MACNFTAVSLLTLGIAFSITLSSVPFPERPAAQLPQGAQPLARRPLMSAIGAASSFGLRNLALRRAKLAELADLLQRRPELWRKYLQPRGAEGKQFI